MSALASWEVSEFHNKLLQLIMEIELAGISVFQYKLITIIRGVVHQYLDVSNLLKNQQTFHVMDPPPTASVKRKVFWPHDFPGDCWFSTTSKF